MATLREIKRRIGSIKSTQQITKAMKMVAAAKMRRAQENILATRPYAFKIREMMQDLMAQSSNFQDPLMQEREIGRMYLVVVTADRGFKREYHIEKSFLDLFNKLEYHHAKEISKYLISEFLAGKVDNIKIVYNEFKNVAQQNLRVETYLPIPRQAAEITEVADYIFEPGHEEILRKLLPKFLDVEMWRVLLESYAAEQGARMTAMENATENAKELIYQLTLQYNKARQAAITKEISEIVGGAEALKSAG